MEENSELGAYFHLTEGVKTGVKAEGKHYTYMFDNGVAVMQLMGPIYPRANMMTMSGATSLQQFTKEFASLYDNTDVKGIVMHVDSPGGDARGLGDASNFIHDMVKKNKKPVKTFADGYMASAAYYIGSTAQEIIGSRSSLVGSIGVVLSAKATPAGQYEIVSSQSPHKRVDPSTTEGQDVIKEMLNDMCDLFVEDVANFRNITTEKVLSDYGQGKVLVGPRAKQQGLIDRIGTLDSTIASVAKEAETKSFAMPKKRKVTSQVAEILSFTTGDYEDMGLKDIVGKFRASNASLLSDEEQAQPDESVAESGEQQSGSGPAPEPPQATREELEEKFSDSVELFATQMLMENRVYPSQQGYVAADMLIARIDDAVHGGQVAFLTPEGTIAEGTREDAVRARYASMPKHSMTQRAITGIKDGSIAAHVLKEEDPETSKDDDTGPISDERRRALLSQTQQGRKALSTAQQTG